MFYLKRLRHISDWLLLLLLIFLPRLFHLDVFLTPDEPLFLEHAQAFAAGLASGDYGQTLGIGYPGVTVAAWSAPFVSRGEPDLTVYAAGRLANAIAGGLLLLLLYALTRRLLGPGPALLGVGMLALDPYTLAYSRLLHIAAPLALFMTLAGVAFLLWLQDERRRWLLLTGLFVALALLTKSTALLLGPMFIALLGGWLLTTGQWPDTRHWLPKIGSLLLIGLIAGLVFFALWPAMWVEPGAALSLTFGKLFTDQEAGTGNLGLFWLGRFVEDPGPAFYPVAFLLKATPWLLVGLGLSLWQTVVRNAYYVVRKPANATHRALRTTPTPSTPNSPPPSTVYRLPSPIPLWLFALTYLLLMTIASKKSIRYMLPAFPTFYLLAGLAFARLLEGWKKWFPISQYPNLLISPSTHLPSTVYRLPSTLVWLLLLTFTLLYHPYYFTYNNPLLLGWRWAPHTLLVGWGEGLDQAATYLNHQPPATVAAWYEWLFPLYYRGQTEPVVPQENLITADHSVLYLNQVQRDIPGPNIIDYFRARRRPEHTVRLAGIDYAWVYPGPIAALDRPDPRPQVPLGGDFGGEARLLGYDLHPESLSGEPLIVTLYWRILNQPAGERFVYLRLVDTQGHIWASTDSPPVLGLWPVERWQPGMLLEDAQLLPIPPGTPPGVYRLEVGLYDPASGQVLAASSQPVGQGGGLLLGEVTVAWQSLAVDPDLPRPTDTRLAPNARLAGTSTLPTATTTGDLLPVELAWREAGTFSSFLVKPYNDAVMFEWRDRNDQVVAEQFEPLPLPVAEWGRGALLRSQHDLIVPPGLSDGDYTVWLALHDGSTPAGDPFPLGRLSVTAPPHSFDLPPGAIPFTGPGLAQDVRLVGYDLAPGDQTVDLHLYWQTETPLTRRYKVFAQLLAADNTVVAQSDSAPAAGQRPTTGWLPQEIITDSHTLPFLLDLPPGSYRLITGLYDPLTGQRLAALDQNGDPVADYISVTEVNLP